MCGARHRPRSSDDRLRAPILSKLGAPIDSAWLSALRVLLGGVICLSVLRFAIYDRIDPLLVNPPFHFKYWGFGWVTPLPGPAMHALIWTLAALCVCVSAGFCFRVTSAAVALGFAYLQLIDVAIYLNHYYLVVLLAALLALSPAGQNGSIDAWLARRAQPAAAAPRAHTIRAVWLYLFRFQVAVVYTFAGLAKANADWLVHAQPLRIWLANRSELPLLGTLFLQPWAAPVMSWAGFLFDSSIAWLLLIPRIRPFAYCAVLAFHALTYLLFPAIGMFPVLMTLSALVFFSASWPRPWIERLRRILGRRKPKVAGEVSAATRADAAPPTPYHPSRWQAAWLACGALYCLVQLVIPLRYLAYGGNVHWHEQGMRFSWRVMVRQKGASVTFLVRNKRTQQTWQISPDVYLNRLQEREMAEQPDLILQFAHHIRDDFAQRGLGPVEVRAEARASLNGRASHLLIDPRIDLGSIADGLRRARWILPSPTEPPPHSHATS